MVNCVLMKYTDASAVLFACSLFCLLNLMVIAGHRGYVAPNDWMIVDLCFYVGGI